MAEIKRINDEEFNDIASRLKFDRAKLTKDYFITTLLYLIRDINGIYFKGGTALNKIFLNHARLSEDIDFSLTRDVRKVKEEIIEIIKRSKLFNNITLDKNVEGFTRIIAHYTTFDGLRDNVFIDLNQRAKLSLPTEEHEITHFYYPFIPRFSVKTVAKKEMICDKVAATIGRNKPRDHYDVYMLLKKGVVINMNLVKDKCNESGDEFSILKMFNKAKMLKNRWDRDMVSLIAEPISFREVIQYLSKHFNLKEEKNKKEEKEKIRIVTTHTRKIGVYRRSPIQTGSNHHFLISQCCICSFKSSYSKNTHQICSFFRTNIFTTIIFRTCNPRFRTINHLTSLI